MKPLDLENRLIEFASRIIKLVEKLPNSSGAKHLGNQLLRSGTAPALNYGEAQAAESRVDFIHKMKICLKELRETSVNLKLIQKHPYYPNNKLVPIIKESLELIAIFTAITKTAIGKQNKA